MRRKVVAFLIAISGAMLIPSMADATAVRDRFETEVTIHANLESVVLGGKVISEKHSCRDRIVGLFHRSGARHDFKRLGTSNANAKGRWRFYMAEIPPGHYFAAAREVTLRNARCLRGRSERIHF